MNSLFKGSSTSSKDIKRFLLKGNLNKEIPDDLMDGLIRYVDLFLKEGFALTQIVEISSIGQIIANESVLEKIKEELISGTFQGGYSTDSFDIKENYIDLLQITLANEESYALAYNSPGDYWGTFTGIIWILKLKERLRVSEIPNTHIDFTN